MSVDHKRPMFAFVMVALICGLVIAGQMRSDAQWGPGRPFSVVAGSEIEPVPSSDPPLLGHVPPGHVPPGDGAAEATTPGGPAVAVGPGEPRRTPAAPATSAAAPEGSAEGGAAGPAPSAGVVTPAPQAPGQGQSAPGGPGNVPQQLDLGETVQQELQAATPSGAPGQGQGQGHAHGRSNGNGNAYGRGQGHGVARSVGDGRGAEPGRGAGSDRDAAVEARGDHAEQRPTDADAGDETGRDEPVEVGAEETVVPALPSLPGWLEEAVTPRSVPAPPRR